jgi:hypothetical protein
MVSGSESRIDRIFRHQSVRACRLPPALWTIKITRGKNGARHHYWVLVPEKDLYIDQRLDDASFSPTI